MVSDAKKNEEIQAALVNLRHLNSRFHNKIQELNALKTTLEDALDEPTEETTEKRVTHQECEVLKTKLKSLSELKQKNENLAEAFNIKFGLFASGEAANVDKEFEDSVAAYYKLKVDVERLIRRLRRKLTTSENHGGEDIVEKDVENIPDDTSKGDGDKGDQKSSDESDDDQPDKTNVVQEGMALWKKVAIGMVVVIVFYCGLGLVINHVLEGRAKSATTGLWHHKINTLHTNI